MSILTGWPRALGPRRELIWTSLAGSEALRTPERFVLPIVEGVAFVEC